MEPTTANLSIAEAVAKISEEVISPPTLGNERTALSSMQEPLAAGAKSIADIERLMAELLVARDYLQAEGERVRRANANYAHLAQTASASVKVIAENIGRWRSFEQSMAIPPLPEAIE
jgi:phage terminase large subunit-like protein